ncbi:MAG: PKD domain-containing protein, partial [Thermoplasmata archaeon]|nr:PKD domain-containing protein [Thermoplasmata archaeon]
MYTCTELDGDSVTWYLETNASWLNMLGNKLSGTPGDYDKGPYYVNVSCDDNNGSVIYSDFILTIIPATDAPVFISEVQNIEFEEDSYYILNLSGKGLDVDGDKLSWYFEGVPVELVEIVQIDDENFNIYGKPNKFGSHQVILWLMDDSIENLKNNQTLWLNITPVNDRSSKPGITYEITDADPATPGNQNLTVQFTALPPLDVDGEVDFIYAWDFKNNGNVDTYGLNKISVTHTFSGSDEYIVNLSTTDSGGLNNWNTIEISVIAPNAMNGNGDGGGNGNGNGSDGDDGDGDDGDGDDGDGDDGDGDDGDGDDGDGDDSDDSDSNLNADDEKNETTSDETSQLFNYVELGVLVVITIIILIAAVIFKRNT